MTTKNPHGLTRANRANLKKLAAYLDSLPRSYKHFEMASFISGRGETDADVLKYMLKNGGLYNNCKTSGCALGHGPAAGVLARLGTDVVVRSDYWNGGTFRVMCWSTYGERFVANSADGGDNERLWSFLFSGNWDAVDNHHYGAAARIKFILAGNEAPDGYYDGNEDEMKESMKLYKEFRK